MTTFWNTLALLIAIISISTHEVLSSPSLHRWGVIRRSTRSCAELPTTLGLDVAFSPLIVRGGSIDDESEDDVDLDESEESSDEDDDETEDEYSDEEEDEDESEVSEEEEADAVTVDVDDAEYDEMMVPSPLSQMYAVFGVMIISKRLDMTKPSIVRGAR